MLSDKAIAAAALAIGCSQSVVAAVAKVESRGSGFYADGMVKTLFEGHHFYKYTKGKYATSNPSVCYQRWDKSKYGKTEAAERARFAEALALDRNAALLSASYGRFQVMGFNFATCGWKTVESFYADMCISEDEHLAAFVGFVIANKLQGFLIRREWPKFAAVYNGPGYAANHYDTKLADAFAEAEGIAERSRK